MDSAPAENQNITFSQSTSHPILKDSFEQYVLMKQGMGVQEPNCDPSGLLISASKEDQKSESEAKRLKLSGINNLFPLKEAPALQSLAELSNITTHSPNSNKVLLMVVNELMLNL